MDEPTFGERLAAARRLKGFRTQEALADLIGVSSRTIRNYETGKTKPDAGTLEALQKALGAFDRSGDPVEVAVRQSQLIEWRQDAVVSFYKRNLAEQDEGRTA